MIICSHVCGPEATAGIHRATADTKDPSWPAVHVCSADDSEWTDSSGCLGLQQRRLRRTNMRPESHIGAASCRILQRGLQRANSLHRRYTSTALHVKQTPIRKIAIDEKAMGKLFYNFCSRKPQDLHIKVSFA